MKILFMAGRWAQNVEESKNYQALTGKAEVHLTRETDQNVLAGMAEDEQRETSEDDPDY